MSGLRPSWLRLPSPCRCGIATRARRSSPSVSWLRSSSFSRTAPTSRACSRAPRAAPGGCGSSARGASRPPVSPAADNGPLIAQVFAQLADGQFHSGEDLAQQLKVSRSAVWKAVKSLKDLGATLHAVRNRGYRLAKSSEPLAAERILESLSSADRTHVR